MDIEIYRISKVRSQRQHSKRVDRLPTTVQKPWRVHQYTMLELSFSGIARDERRFWRTVSLVVNIKSKAFKRQGGTKRVRVRLLAYSTPAFFS